MSHHNHSNISIIEAVETLSNIADLEFDKGIGIARKHEIVLDEEKVNYKTVHWLHEQNAASTISIVKETFRTVLQYLKKFYKYEYGYLTDLKTIEGIKTIMVLVGEAAKKLDKYTQLFQSEYSGSITDLKEYKQLQEFYLTKIDRKIDEGVLGKWILGLSLNKITKEKKEPPKLPEIVSVKTLQDTKYVFVDLETVKKDLEYELFFIRKEDGTRFFNPRLLRNIKLVCDFGNYFGEQRKNDPFLNVAGLLDKIYHLAARDVLKAIGSFQLEHFYHDVRKIKGHEVVTILSKALMALLLSSHSSNLLHNHPVKTCKEYFEDFVLFMREVLNTRTYQKWIVYSQSPTPLTTDLLTLIHSICGAFYSNLKGFEEITPAIDYLIHEAHQHVSQEHQQEAQDSNKVWNRLASDYVAMTKMIKQHPNGPVVKILSILEEDVFAIFDPIMLHSMPCKLFDLKSDGQRIMNLRIPAPIYQEFINRAVVNDEFKTFLRGYKQSANKKHLLINLEDRTSWLEYARSVALEELQNHSDFKDSICVVTMATDTDFYNQLTPYNDISHANTFIKQLKEHTKGEESGFYYPETINKKVLFEFIDRSIEIIHRVFFSNKNVLPRESRLDFIEILYTFIIFKIIDVVKPDSFSLTCKDGIDISMPYNVEMYVLLKLINQSEFTEGDNSYMNFLLYGPSIAIRERALIPERFNRMLSMIKAIESVQEMQGKEGFAQLIQKEFGPLFSGSLLKIDRDYTHN